ncbi:MAG: hypothetical protein FJ405_08880 [Verrucomicrobia bacterium]|nr:hypothetical protein [Verrucomicrobiota bacterium]
MNKNRRSQAGAIWVGPALKALLLCLFFGGAALGYAWQHRKLGELDAIQRSLEVQLDLLRRDNRILGEQLAELQQPTRLMQRAARLQPPMSVALPSQTIRLPEPRPSVSRLYSDALSANVQRGASRPYPAN